MILAWQNYYGGQQPLYYDPLVWSWTSIATLRFPHGPIVAMHRQAIVPQFRQQPALAQMRRNNAR